MGIFTPNFTLYKPDVGETGWGLLVNANVDTIDTELLTQQTAIALNTAKVTNAAHTGEVTGSTVLTLDPTAITNKGAGTVASGDLLILSDIDDSNNLKQVTAQSIADLSTSGGSSETVTKDITQATHGLSVGNWIRHDGAGYVLAQADVDANSDTLGVVSAVADVNNFTLLSHGYITGLAGLTAGDAHFLSDTVAGTITAVPPADLGEIVKPVIIADSATSGYVNIFRGNEITAAVNFDVAVLDEGGSLTTSVTSIDFVGAGVTATNVGDAVTVTIPGGGGSTLELDVTQANAFSVDEWVYHNGTIYALADASAAATAESIGVITAATGADFTVQFGGRITGLSGLTAGEAHFLSETAGLITATAPVTVGAVVKPVLVADSTTSGFIFNMRGSEIVGSAASSYAESFVDADLTAGVLTVTHSLGVQYVLVAIYDNNDLMILPDEITATSTTACAVDLSSFGTLTGTWNLRVTG